MAVAIILPAATRNLAGTDSLTNEVNTDARRTGHRRRPARRARRRAAWRRRRRDMNVALFVQAHNDTVNRRDDGDDSSTHQTSSNIRAPATSSGTPM